MSMRDVIQAWKAEHEGEMAVAQMCDKAGRVNDSTICLHRASRLGRCIKEAVAALAIGDDSPERTIRELAEARTRIAELQVQLLDADTYRERLSRENAIRLREQGLGGALRRGLAEIIEKAKEIQAIDDEGIRRPPQ